jgi:plastocyanin
MHRGRSAAILALALTLGLVAVACGEQQPSRGGGSTDGQGTEGTSSFSIEDANDHGAVDLSGQAETSLELDDFYFEPTVLMGEPGQITNIELENEGDQAHTFTLDDGSVDEEIQSGDKVEVDVTWPDSGSLRFICRFHEGGGMIGALSVEGDLGASAAVQQDQSGGGGGGDDSGPGYG